MKPLLTLFAAAASLALAGCGHLEPSPIGDPSRVLTGEVSLGDAVALPTDVVVTVRILDGTAVGQPPMVIGSQTINNPGVAPIPFRVEYRAEDDLLRKGLNIDVRVSIDGKVRFYNKNSYVVTLGNAADEHRISVNPVGP